MPNRKRDKVVKKKRVPKELVRSNNVVVKKPTSKRGIWKPVINYEGYYEVSSKGGVRSIKRTIPYSDGRPSRNLSVKVISQTFDKDGYKLVRLYKDGNGVTFKVHRLVAQAFIPNPRNLPEVNHKNEVKDDNGVENLEWCTRKDNMNYGNRGKKASESLTKFVYQRFSLKGEFIDTLTYPQIIEEGFDYGFVTKAATGVYNSAYGLIWKKLPVEEYNSKVTPKLRSNGTVVNNPTSKGTWKSFENLVAKFFGTRRVPLSGSNSGHGTNSDSLHPKLYIECKVRSKIALWQLFTDTEKKAKVESKVPVVAVKQKGEKGYLLLIRPEDLQKIAEIQKEVPEVTE